MGPEDKREGLILSYYCNSLKDVAKRNGFPKLATNRAAIGPFRAMLGNAPVLYFGLPLDQSRTTVGREFILVSCVSLCARRLQFNGFP